MAEEAREQTGKTLQREIRRLRARVTELETRLVGQSTAPPPLARDVSPDTAVAIRAIQEQLTLFMDNMPAAVFVKDYAGRHLFMNRELERTMGLSREDWFQRTNEEIFGRRVGTPFNESDRNVLASGRSMQVVDVTGEGQEQHYWLTTKFLIPPVEGGAALLGGIAFDITDRVRAEADLRESELRYRTLAEGAPVGIFRTDPDGLVVEVNRRICMITGRTRDELLADRWVLAMHSEDRDNGQHWWNTLIAEGKPGETTVRVRHPGGKTRYVYFQATPILDDAGELQGFTGTVTDVTNARLTWQERERLARAVAHTSETVIITDVDGCITYVNPAFETITGYTREEALGKNPRFLSSGRHHKRFYRELWETIISGRAWRGRFENRRKDGALYIEDATISPVRALSGAVVGYVAVKRDVTETLRMREELHQAQRLEAVGRLAAGVAHDFNNLLTVIIGYANMLLQQHPAESHSHEYLRGILGAGEAGAELTNQLLTFSRKQPVEPVPLDINEHVASTEPLLRRLVPENIDIDFSLGAETGWVRADYAQLNQVLMNLAANAADAMPGGGRIFIRTFRRELKPGAQKAPASPGVPWCMVIEVADTGAGMDEDVLRMAFEPFFTTKAAGKGTGLGLSTVWGIATRLGGRVDIDSAPGVGTTVRVSLPETTDQTPRSKITKPAQPEAKTFHGVETVLVVEDNPGVRRMVVTSLSEAGYRVLEAGDGSRALALLAEAEGGVDLLLADVVLPGVSGTELAKQAGKQDPPVAVVLVSGYGSGPLLDSTVASHDVEFLQKPFTTTDLLREIRVALDRRGE